MHWVRGRIASVDRGIGRITIGAVAGLMLLASSFVVVTSVLPAGAGSGDPSAAGVQPTEEDLGGQPNDCLAVSSAATNELRIQNPANGSFTGPAGAVFDLVVSGNDKNLDFTLSGASLVVFDVVVKGGSNSTHFDYEASTVGPVTADQDLHAPTKGNGSNLFNISHVSFCYEPAVELSGLVRVDEIIDGNLNVENNEGGRVVKAYDGTTVAGSATSAADGTYSILVAPGVGALTICEDERDGYVQVDREPSIYSPGTVCSGIAGAEPKGHSITVAQDPVGGLDFDNALEICGQNLTASQGIFDADFTLFGDGFKACDAKAGDLSIAGGTVELPIVGTGTVAGIGIITKDFASTEDFADLTFSSDNVDFEPLEWCGLRDKDPLDPDVFDAYVPAGKYPTLAGVTYVSNLAVSCKVHVVEGLAGSGDAPTAGEQVTVVYIAEDPYWR